MDSQMNSLRLQAAIEVAKLAGQLIISGAEKGIQTSVKGRNDFVTVMDVQSEELIKSYLHERFPQDNFLGEEMGYQKYGDGGTWIIDPIDGTTNYIHQLPGFTISIAFEEQSWHPVIGVVYDPTQKELFWAQEGKGAFLGEKPIHVSAVDDPHESVFMISPPLRKVERMNTYMQIFEHLCGDAGEVRDYGSAALHLCYVATGRAEAFIEYNLKYHDIAAGMVIVKEAKGDISPLDPQEQLNWPGNIIASNAALHTWLCDYLHRY